MLDAITRGYLALHPAAAAQTLARLDTRDIKAIFMAMPHQLAAEVFGHMMPGAASRCLAELPPGKAGEILARTPILAAVAALRLMQRDQVQSLLAALPRPAAARLRLRLHYPETVIGAFVDADVITLAPAHRAGDAVRLFRRAAQHTVQTIPVVDEHRHLAGVVDLGDLLGASDRTTIQRLLQPPPVVLNARAALQTVANHPAWLSHDSLPVINRRGVFQGVLRRTKVMEKEQQLVTEVTDHSETARTRAALADIFWMGVGALLVGNNPPPAHRPTDD